MDSRHKIVHSKLSRLAHKQSKEASQLVKKSCSKEERDQMYANLDAGFGDIKACLEEARWLNALGPFPFLRLPKELRLMIYDYHFESYGTIVDLDEQVPQQDRPKAGVNLLRTCRQIYLEALPRLVRSALFEVDFDPYDDDKPDCHEWNSLVFAHRLSTVGSKVASLIRYLDLRIYISLDNVGRITMDLEALRAMDNLEWLCVEICLPDEEQAKWCRKNYKYSFVLKGLVEELVRAIPPSSKLTWYGDEGMFCPSDVLSLRERINPYRGHSVAPAQSSAALIPY